MQEIINVKKNSFFSLITSVSKLGANVFVFWIMANYFTPVDFGKLTYAATLATVFILFADFGFDLLLTTEISKKPSEIQKIFNEYFPIKLVLILISLSGMWVFIFIGNLSSKSTLLIMLFSCFMFFSTFTNFILAAFRGVGKFIYETKISIIANLGLVGLVIILIYLDSNVLFIGLVFLLSRIIGFAIALRYLFSIIDKIVWQISYEKLKNTIAKTFEFGLIVILSNILFQIDSILLGALKGEFEVGIYQSVVRLTALPLIIPQIIFSAVLPLLVKLHIEDIAKWEYVGYLINKIFMFISFPLGIIMYAYSDQLIGLIYNRTFYASATPLLRIFSIILIVRFFLEPYGYMLTTSKKQKKQMLYLIYSTILNLVLNIIIIPRYSIIGAAFVLLATTVFLASCYGYSTRPLIIEWMKNFQTGMFILISLLLFVIFANNAVKQIFWGIPLLLTVYIFIGLRFFNKSEKKVILSYYKK